MVGSELAPLSRIQTSWRDACALVAYLPRSVVLPGVWGCLLTVGKQLGRRPEPANRL